MSARVSAEIETVVFDLGGVLVDWNPRFLYRKMIPHSIANEEHMESFLRDVCNSEWNEKQDAGRSFAEGVREKCAEFPQHETLIKAYFERWPEMMAGEIPGTVRILETLHREGRHRLFALSNWSAETFPHARSRFQFLDLFAGILLSGEERLIKPDERFFRLLCERFSVRPEKSIFIDDVAKNVEGARRLGFHGVHFQNSIQLQEELSLFGVL